MSFAHTVLHGHLGKDPSTRTAGSSTVTSFSLATTRVSKRDGQKVEHTTWWNVQVWGDRGQRAAQFLRKGSAVIVHGTPELRAWKDDQGCDRQSLDLLNADWSFAGSKGAAAPGDAPAADATPATSAPATVPAGHVTPGMDEPPF